ncbi:MAG: phosphate ABC transporter permease PstA [Thermoanaerobaculia bacterium]
MKKSSWLRAVKRGDPMIWLTGGGLAVCLLMIAWLVGLVTVRGVSSFWPRALVSLETKDGARFLAEIHRREPAPGSTLATPAFRIQTKIANRDVNGLDFRWFDESAIVKSTTPLDALVLERQEYGNFHGFLKGIRRGGAALPDGTSIAVLARLQREARQALLRLRRTEKKEVGFINAQIERERLTLKKAELSRSADLVSMRVQTEHTLEQLRVRYEALRQDLEARALSNATLTGFFDDGSGHEKEIPLQEIVRVVAPNRLDAAGKTLVVFSRIREFLFAEPRESNTEGGVFPAIFGTVLMVLMMSVAVVPFGVVAALYLREYAKDGPLVRIVRIAVNNLAGVPSIVFGIFGLGFFVYGLGGSIDALLFSERLPNPTFGTGGILWCALTLALLTVPVVIVSTEEALAAVPRGVREAALALGSTKWQTTWNIVLPAAAPGILTGLILAMARGAGEVAPLMIVGVVKLSPTLPLDGTFPFLHLERKIMHLGFHIYDVGFQSPNVEAALPMVYSTALLLLVLVLVLNLSAILIRNRLRRKLQAATF